MLEDPALVAQQYRRTENLDARRSLHDRFSTSQVDLQRWLFDLLPAVRVRRVLEVGSGTGVLWQRNADRIPEGWLITMTDRSPGMVREATNGLEGRSIAAAVADARELPFADETFDIAVANHMLYHVPEPEKAIHELCRVIAPDGLLMAATNGLGHMRELLDLIDAAGLAEKSFTLESGAAMLASSFPEVRLEVFEDGLAVTDPDAVVGYAASLIGADATQLALLHDEVAGIIAVDGAMRITKSTGAFLAR